MILLDGAWRRIVDFGFRLLYNELAWTYDLVSWAVSLGHWRRWQLAALDYLPGDHVLEVAHGPGHMLVELARRGYQVIGCDLSPEMGRLARARLRRVGLEKAAPLVRCRIPDLPFAPASFDGILSQFPTRFIMVPATAGALFRLLRPGGVLVILPEGHLTGRGPVIRFIAWLFAITGQSAGGTGANSQAVAALWDSWGRHFADAGFETRAEQLVFDGSACTVLLAVRPGVLVGAETSPHKG